MSVFWQVFLGFIAASVAMRLVVDWLIGKLLRTAQKGGAIRVEGTDRIAKAVADELVRRDLTL